MVAMNWATVHTVKLLVILIAEGRRNRSTPTLALILTIHLAMTHPPPSVLGLTLSFDLNLLTQPNIHSTPFGTSSRPGMSAGGCS
jgi:hypothetical protein